MEEKIRVLLVSGRLTSEHKFQVMNGYLRQMLEATGRFTVRVIEDFNGATERLTSRYDMILLNYDGKETPVDSFERWDPQAEDVFFDFVEKGGGLFIHHSSIWLEDDLPERYKQCWGYYCSMPESRKVPLDDFPVKVSGKDEITQGLKDYLIVGDDLFGGLLKAEGTDPEVILSAYDDLNAYDLKVWPPKHHPVLIPDGDPTKMRGINADAPVMWRHHYGKGRVVGCSIGHDLDTFRRIGYLTSFVRACEWAATGKVTLNAPDRRGERRFRPWPYY